MTTLVENIHNHFLIAYDWAEEVGVEIQQNVSDQVQRTLTTIGDTYHFVEVSCRADIRELKKIYHEIINKIKEFFYQNKEAIFFLGCSAATASFAPHLFFPTAIAVLIIRIELARNLKKAADYYLKDERNPYELNPQYEKCINAIDITLATIAAIDAIALGTISLTNCWTIALLPVLGGLAAGNSAAKWGMNMSDFLA